MAIPCQLIGFGTFPPSATLQTMIELNIWERVKVNIVVIIVIVIIKVIDII